MKISKKEVEYVARLARLELSEEEKKKFSEQLSQILSYINKLNELNTDKVKATSHVLPLTNIFREDKAKESLSQEAVLSGAPSKAKGHFKVPKIIE